MSEVIELPRSIDADLAAEIEKESAFVSPYLGNLRVDPAGNAVQLEIIDQEKVTEVHEKVGRFLDAMLQRRDRLDTKVFLENNRRDDGPYATDLHEELARRKWIFDYGNGNVALSGPVLALARAVDAKAAELYQKHFNAVSGMYPAFVDAKTLARCGYFDSHPNAVSFVAHMVEDFDAIEKFRQANSCGTSVHLPDKDHLHIPGICLNPAACFPCYPTLEGEEIGPDGAAFTWQGRVFRFESRNIAGLERLWEFNVREIVFVGSEEFVVECRKRALPLIGELAATFDLDCKIETATDPFFATVSAAKTFWQEAQEVKNEILLPIGVNDAGVPRNLACGSINIHGNFFGDRFNIGAHDGAAAFTGCIGLGIERWVLAAFAQHGFDLDRWPTAVRSEIFS